MRRFLGEGGKKRVYLAHDSLLDRDVAFALIRTEGLDETGRERVRREAQALARLGGHPHLVTIHDIVFLAEDGTSTLSLGSRWSKFPDARRAGRSFHPAR